MPADVSQAELPRQVRAELRGLPKELAEQVGGFLIMAGRLIEEDPEQAYEFAEAARRRAARLPIVREAAAETAYAAGKYEVALSEFRAIRRMSGNHDVLPAMADCERALGKPQAALKLSREAKELPLDPAQQIEMIIVEAGARRDLGQDAEAARLLRAAIDDLRLTEPGRNAAARLRYAYADVLAYRGDEAAARDWFAAAADLDREQLTDAAERRDALDGVTIDFDLDDDDDHEQDDHEDDRAEVDRAEVSESSDDQASDDDHDAGDGDDADDDHDEADRPAGDR
ncbi:hypothetical protein [Microlunatus parietis]|uniref:Tetratricopeptide (TPR) repeat protein n=1 Tax=Microlunatus parietis TaxID=682979 RepID=A0A7Y9LAI7_9ACTN|nr:hypothetical protein [Microlunatus parietis]NYE69630.1 tetratricopeptide (TPR) repeat protein [Microlunatus parietis]